MVVACTGFFDGVHLGHRSVIDKVCTLAKERGCKSLVITFWPHPRAVLQQDAVNFRLITSLEEKVELLTSMGIDSVEVIPFTREFARLTTRDFFQKYLIDKYGVNYFVVGYDHRVGSDKTQSQQEMLEIAESMNIKTLRVEEFHKDIGVESEIVISSTKIRERVSLGQVDVACRLLGYNYSLSGVVVSGEKLGRKLGFPTANIKLYEPLKLLPKDGVYAVKVLFNGKRYCGITNIGTRPTVSLGVQKSIETHILDFNEQIYGLDLKVEFIKRIRDEKKFDSIEKLIEQLTQDREYASKLLSFID